MGLQYKVPLWSMGICGKRNDKESGLDMTLVIMICPSADSPLFLVLVLMMKTAIMLIIDQNM